MVKVGYDKLISSDSSPSRWCTSNGSDNTFWIVWMGSYADGSKECTPNTPVSHDCSIVRAYWQHLPYVHWWSCDILEEHEKHIDLVLQALQRAHLYMNPKKCWFFLTELDFLSHHISAHGIEPQLSKCKKILQWPTPNLATDVWSFLDLVRYLAVFLLHLAEHTRILTLLMIKEAHKCFLKWETSHNFAFESIKALVWSPQCLTVINHVAPRENKIFLTCDASDWWTGATLSFGHTWETAYPVAYKSAQLSGAEKNYPIHEKELLAIIWALKKWRSDLLGSTIYVYTDHKTLLNFDGQMDLSWRQLW